MWAVIEYCVEHDMPSAQVSLKEIVLVRGLRGGDAAPYRRRLKRGYHNKAAEYLHSRLNYQNILTRYMDGFSHTTHLHTVGVT